MSLDGFIDADKVNPDFSEFSDTPSFAAMIKNTGAIIMGRHVYDGMADPFLWANDGYEFQTPIFVLTHTPPEKYPKGNNRLRFTFVADGIESAISLAVKAAAGKDVQVIGGANAIQQCLNSGLCDELHIDITSVLIGQGLRLFNNIDTDGIQLDRIKIEEPTSARTSITFKVTSANS